MIDKKKNYLSILKLELDDLHQDIDFLISESCKKRESDCITEYVFLENFALFKNEILGVDTFEKIIDKVDIESYDKVEDMIDYLKKEFRTKMSECGISNAIHLSILRKMDKVKKYVEQ